MDGALLRLSFALTSPTFTPGSERMPSLRFCIARAACLPFCPSHT